MTLQDKIDRLRAGEVENQKTVFPDKTRSEMMSTINALEGRLEVAKKGLKMVTDVCQSDLEGYFGKKIANQIRASLAATDLEKEGV